MENKNYLILKWGTLKLWNFDDNEKAQKLLKRFLEIGASSSAIFQENTPEQKEIICKLIDLMPGKIRLDCSGEYVSKKEAKEYIMNFEE